MDTIDHKMETALGGSVPSYSPEFAQAREAVHHSSPAMEVAMREGERLRGKVVELQAKIRALEEAGADLRRIEALEADLSAAVEAWSEFLAVEDAPSPARDLDGHVSLGDLLERDLDTSADLDPETMEIRLATFRDLNRFVFQDGGVNVWLAFKNWLAVVRRTSPEFLDGISKADLAKLLGETRAATCDREIRLVEKVLRDGGARGFQLLGGNKSLETRRRCAESAKGNTSRRSAGKARRG